MSASCTGLNITPSSELGDPHTSPCAVAPYGKHWGGTRCLFPSPAGTLQPESREQGNDEVMLLNIEISSQPFSPATRSGCCRLGHCRAVPGA